MGKESKIHDLVSINSQCFKGSGLPVLEDAWSRLRPSRVSFEGAFLNSDPAGVGQLVRSGPYAFETIIYSFLAGHQLDADAAVIAGEQEKLSRAIDLAVSLGAHSLYMAPGGRGRFSWEEAAQAFCATIAPAVEQAAAAGLLLAIENTPALYADVSITTSLFDTVLLAEMAGMGVCMDYFSCWTEATLQQTIERAAPRLHLVQIADYVYGDRSLPARAVPGDGAVPIRRLIDWTLSTGYRGAFELETMGPRINAEGHFSATSRGAEQISEMLHSLGA